jgi:hypothetical protein
MKLPSKELVEQLRKTYAKGTRVCLPSGMSDPYSPLPAGICGTVQYVDDMANIGVKWDNGSTLNAIYGEDEIRKLTRAEQIIEDVNKLRKLPNCPNMFDRNAVMQLAVEENCNAVADFLFMWTNDWGAFILTGELPADIEEDLI